MVLAQLVVDSVLLQKRSVRETAQRYGVSKSWVQELVRRFREGGTSALEPRSKAPRSNPTAIAPALAERIVELRKELSDRGTSAGAETIAWHLKRQGLTPPSVSTIYRVLQRRGFITPEPRKRPRSSYLRFEASLPNECWQSDMTHWTLANATTAEIVTFIDDYSRRVLACEVYNTVNAPIVRRLFKRTCERWGVPASVLTDNGLIYNARAVKGRTGFESDLGALGVLYKHSTPYHPQTCGKVERWHRTLKGMLEKRNVDTMAELQGVLNDVVRYYNDERPHRARDRSTPRDAYESREKLGPNTLINQPHHRIRYDVADQRGHVTLRYLGKLRHLNVGWGYRGERVRLYVVDDEVTVANEDGELIGEITLNPNRDYQPIRRPAKS